jgi:protein TonB
MSEPVIFKDLPATFPEKDRYKRPSVISSVIFHVVLIAVLILIPLLLPETISQRELLITLAAPPPPPPAAPPPPPVPVAVAVAPRAVKPPVQPVAPGALVMPTVIPKDVAKIIEEPIVPLTGVIGGVPGGVPGGVAGGILGNILSANSNAAVLPAPPPPPPPPPPRVVAPAEPVRVGGVVKEPRVVKLVPPLYPPLASRARVTGTVILEAILTEDGTVDQIRVISGHPLLIDAAINCVKQWRYEPTLLNGIPVRVVLTAKVHFDKPIS